MRTVFPPFRGQYGHCRRPDMAWTIPRLTVDQDVAGSTPVSHPYYSVVKVLIHSYLNIITFIIVININKANKSQKILFDSLADLINFHLMFCFIDSISYILLFFTKKSIKSSFVSICSTRLNTTFSHNLI